MGQVVSYRMAKVARAPFSMSAALLVPKLVSLATNSVRVLNTVAAVSAGIGTYVAVAPWFSSLANEFPANDQAHSPPLASSAANQQPANPAGNPETADSPLPTESAELAIDVEAQPRTYLGASDSVRSI